MRHRLTNDFAAPTSRTSSILLKDSFFWRVSAARALRRHCATWRGHVSWRSPDRGPHLVASNATVLSVSEVPTGCG